MKKIIAMILVLILVLTTAEEIEYKLNDKIKIYRLDKINQNNNFIIKNNYSISSYNFIIKTCHIIYI